MIAQIFIPITELVISTEIQRIEANPEIEKNPVTIEAKVESAQDNLNFYMSLYTFYSLNHYVLFHLKDNFLFQ